MTGPTTIYTGSPEDSNRYLRPMSYNPTTRRWGQKDVYYVFNGQCKKIGSGSMGTVYLCDTYNNPKEKVAVKVVKTQFSNNPKIRLRAKQEASMSFVHPHLIEMLGFCELNPQNGPLLVLSRYFEGQNISEYINNLNDSPNRAEEICSLITQVLDGLDYIHSFKITHRDVKPSNIMVNSDGVVKLMDLGIARVNGGNKFSSMGFVGTPEFASPEQIRGEEGTSIGPWTDIYCLGITLYVLLTGFNPFKASSDLDTLRNQLSMRLPKDQSIPSSLMKVLWKATEKESGRRFQTAGEFSFAISNSFSEKSIWERIKEWFKS